MLKMTTVAAIALMIAFAASPVAAQCTLGVYGDVAGSESLVSPVLGEPFDVYVVMFVEGLVNGVGYTLVSENADDLTALGAGAFGPDGGGLNIPNDQNNPVFGGANVGLGLCAVGFGGLGIEVAKYTFLPLTSTREATLSVVGNDRSSDLGPELPVFSDCQGVISQCDIGPSLTIEQPVSEGNESFGAVKSLYN